MSTSKLLLAFSFVLLTSTAVNAQTTQKSDKVKIVNGVKNGELTKRETRHLVHQERKINRDKKAARADGTVTTQEAAKIRREKERADASIYRKKHNNRTRN